MGNKLSDEQFYGVLSGLFIFCVFGFTLGFVLGEGRTNNILLMYPIKKCEIEHDLPRSQTCEMLAVVKEQNNDR